MGETTGHVSIGLAYLVIGLWHLFNCIKLHILHPKSYTTLPWFPVRAMRYLEPFVIISVCLIFILMEIFIGRHPLDKDGAIISRYLRHIEHSTMAMAFTVYAFFAVLLDKIASHARYGLIHFLQAAAFGQQLLMLHLHSTDHMGIEGQYHWLLQLVTFVALLTTVLAISHPTSFLNGFMRSFSVLFQGVWLIVTGIMLWTPDLMPKGCILKEESGREVIGCHSNRALERAKALVNLQFSWYFIGLTIFSVSLYLVMIRLYGEEKAEYRPITQYECQEMDKKLDCV